MRCVLVGNYGTGNLGDEALKEYFLSRFLEIEWTVLSAVPTAPNEVPRFPCGLRSLLIAPWWRSLRALRRSDAVVFGGGSLFTDAESMWACVLWWWHAVIARIFGKPVFLAFQGVGPFRTRLGKWCAKSAVTAADFVSVRDTQSAERVGDWVKTGVRVIQSFDPVFGIFTGEESLPSGNTLAVIPRMNSGDDFRTLVMDRVKRDTPQSVRIISMQPDSSQEQRACLCLTGNIGQAAQIIPVRSLSELSDSLRGCSAVITARYHGGLAAIALSIPMIVVAQHPGDKLDLLMRAQELGAQELRSRLSEGERELQKALNMVK